MEQQAHLQHHHETRAGTIGGTLFCFIANLQAADFYKTIVLAAVGAAVSFVVSLCLKKMVERLK